MSTMLYVNGTIYTMNAAQPIAQAMAIDSATGYLVAVGSRRSTRARVIAGSDSSMTS